MIKSLKKSNNLLINHVKINKKKLSTFFSNIQEIFENLLNFKEIFNFYRLILKGENHVLLTFFSKF